MKKLVFCSFNVLLACILLCAVSACVNDDEASEPAASQTSQSANNGDNNQVDRNTAGQVAIIVTVDEDGKADGNHSFSKIDDQSFYVDGIKYVIKDDGLAVTGFDKENANGSFCIISQLNYGGKEMKVTSIGDEAFLNYQKKSSQNGVDLIGPYNYIDELIIPESVVSIGQKAFMGCHGLKVIKIPAGIKTISDFTFWGCPDLTTVILPDELIKVGIAAFADCPSLASLVLPKSVTEIGTGALKGCAALSSIHIPSSVEKIGQEAFWLCDALSSITVDEDNTTYDSRENCNAIIETATNKLVYAISNSTIPNSVTWIGEAAYAGCPEMKTLTISSSVTKVEKNAFAACEQLEDIYCYAAEPPHCVSGCPFNQVLADNLTLHVPASAIESYKTDYWGLIKNVVPIE